MMMANTATSITPANHPPTPIPRAPPRSISNMLTTMPPATIEIIPPRDSERKTLEIEMANITSKIQAGRKSSEPNFSSISAAL